MLSSEIPAPKNQLSVDFAKLVADLKMEIMNRKAQSKNLEFVEREYFGSVVLAPEKSEKVK